MTRLPKLTAALLAASFVVFSATASADFTGGMTQAQIQAEITSMLSTINPATGKNFTLVEVGQSAKQAGLTSSMFTADAIARGSVAADVVTAAMTVWGLPDTKNILDAAIVAAPGQTTAIQTAAIAAGADPTVVASTGAGGPVGGVGGVGGAPAGTPAPALGGGAGAGGGGGGGVASPA